MRGREYELYLQSMEGTPALTPALSRSGRGGVLGRVVVVREFDK
nr:hypothetical protein [uncultured Methanoregula sp.]